MKIVVDDKIPYISNTLERLADEVVYLPGGRISADDVRDADALIIRTRTRCNESLLKGSRVQFVATATIGFDHIDTDYCERNGIFWTNCPGCNADSVNQYIRECLRWLLRDGKVSEGAMIGVIGYGHVGSRVAETANRLGFKVIISDPPLLGGGDELQEAIPNCDIITFHTPLTFSGAYKTFHLADEAFFRRLKKRPVIINSSRGEVIDNQALLKALEEGVVSEVILDVWENEPDILLPLLRRTYIATPHIAGYSANGKVNADNMVVEALCKHFHLERPAVILPPDIPYAGYNPKDDHEKLVAHPEDFEKLRGEYPVRLE